MESGLGYKNKWQFRLANDQGELIDVWEMDNIIVNEGLTHSLDLLLGDISNHAWYLTLIDSSHVPDATDTYVNTMSDANYEFINYQETARPLWIPGAAAGQSIDNDDNWAVFTMNDTSPPYTIYGAALVSGSAKNDSSSGEFLFAYGLFSEAKTNMAADSQIYVKLTVTAGNL